jgi:hypothetical protein
VITASMGAGHTSKITIIEKADLEPRHRPSVPRWPGTAYGWIWRTGGSRELLEDAASSPLLRAIDPESPYRRDQSAMARASIRPLLQSPQKSVCVNRSSLNSRGLPLRKTKCWSNRCRYTRFAAGEAEGSFGGDGRKKGLYQGAQSEWNRAVSMDDGDDSFPLLQRE